jgi:hypothetical protein
MPKFNLPNISSLPVLMLELITTVNTPDGNLSTVTPIDTSKLFNANYLANKLTLLNLSNNTKTRILMLILSFTSLLQFGQDPNATSTTTFSDYSNLHGNTVTLKLRY